MLGSVGVGIVWVSGLCVFEIVDGLFWGKWCLSVILGGCFLFGELYVDEELFDEGLCLVFCGLCSYIGEDVVEV